MKRYTIIIDQQHGKEPFSLLFFEHEGIFISYLLKNATEQVGNWFNEDLNALVDVVQQELIQMGNYEIIEPNGFDDQTMDILNRLRNR